MCNVYAVGIRECPKPEVRMAMFWPDEWKNTVNGKDMKPRIVPEGNVEARDDSIFFD